MKIIQISSASSSFAVKDYENDIYNGWYAQVARQIKKLYPKTEIECWIPERKYKKQKENEKEGIKFRIFPTDFSIRHGMEISSKMAKALLSEIKQAKKDKTKLIIEFHEYHSWLIYMILFLIGRKHKNIGIAAQHHGGRSPIKNLLKYKRLILFLPAIFMMYYFEKLLFKRINLFYALSNDEIEYLKKVALKSEIKFQTMGIENEYFDKTNKQEARKKLKLDEKKKYGLYLGRIKTTKGVKELLDSMKTFEDKNIELILIGEGVDFDKYVNYSKENNIHNVRFLGPKFGKEKMLYLAACDFLILPSYTEGAPVVIMEAVARNLPVIATNVGGIPKMIENNKEGIIIQPKSSEEIVKAIKEIIKWKKDVRKYGEKYKWERIIKNTMKDYEKVVEEK